MSDILRDMEDKMSKDVIRLTIPDLSDFAKHLRAALPDGPGHVEMLNLVAKAAGFRNFQHLRSQNPPQPVIDQKRIDRALRTFAEDGRWREWPGKRGVRELCLWVIWARLPARTIWREREISAILDEHCCFHDAAQIRRSLIKMRLLTRNPDGTGYMRIEAPMDPEGAALLAQLNARKKALDSANEG